MRPIAFVPAFSALTFTILSACNFDANRLRAVPDAMTSNLDLAIPDMAIPIDTAPLNPRTGGISATGGSLRTGGVPTTGGMTTFGGIISGGIISAGGFISAGGRVTTGGVAAIGGLAATGGVAQTGGFTTTGGIVFTTGGDRVSAGGTTASGGVRVATGGATPSTGGAPGNTGTAVTFLNGQALGAMSGYGWIAMGAKTTVIDPTCGPEKTRFTSSAYCQSTVNWSDPFKLCMSASIPALPNSPGKADFEINWGISLGINATDPLGFGLGQSYSSIAITFSGLPSGDLRTLVHKQGESYTISYCADLLASGTAIPFTNFVTDCYNPVPFGTRITAADVPSIDRVMVQVPSAAADVNVNNLCITGITFTK